MTSELVPSVSIEALVGARDAAAKLIREAHEKLVEANRVNMAFFGADPETDRFERWVIHLFDERHRGNDFLDDDGPELQIKQMDAHYWDTLLEKSGLRTFMDAERRERWRKDIAELKVPELTAANIEATFASLYAARGAMFEEGVLSFFRKLSWDFKTNNPVKLGKRVILNYAVSTLGNGRSRWTSGIAYEAGNKLDDIIRVFSVVDGKPEPDHRYGAHNMLNVAGWMKDGTNVNEADLRYLTIRGFKNGNAHVTFLRPDLVDKLNKIIAKHYPNCLPPSRETL